MRTTAWSRRRWPAGAGVARDQRFCCQVRARFAPHPTPLPARALRYLHRFLKMSRNNDLHQTAPCASPSAGNDQKSRLSLSLRLGILRCVDTVAQARGREQTESAARGDHISPKRALGKIDRWLGRVEGRYFGFDPLSLPYHSLAKLARMGQSEIDAVRALLSFSRGRSDGRSAAGGSTRSARPGRWP